MESKKQIRFAQKVKEYRKIHNISAVQLAQAMGVAPTTVSMWECGKSYPDVLKFVELCGFLHVSADEILFGLENDFLSGLTDMQKFLVTQTVKEFKTKNGW